MTQVITAENGKMQELYVFNYRFQARTWLVLNGYWMQDGNDYTNPYTGATATLESRKII